MKRTTRPAFSWLIASVIAGAPLTVFPQSALAQVSVRADLTAKVVWKAGKAPKDNNNSFFGATAVADFRAIQASDYASIYLCVVAACVLEALPAVEIAPAQIGVIRPFTIVRDGVPKWATLAARQLGGTEYNGSLHSNGPNGSVAVAQHSVRTEFDNVQNAGSVRAGAVADGRQPEGASCLCLLEPQTLSNGTLMSRHFLNI